jgi:hypothetical protein
MNQKQTYPFSNRRDVPPGGQTGTSLLEVLIAVAISGFLFSAACETLARFGERFRTQHSEAGLHQESRIGLDVLGNELRLAGTGGVPGQSPFSKIDHDEIWFRANLGGFQTVLKETALPGQLDLVVEDGDGWPEGKQVVLCSREHCMSNRLARNGRAAALTLAMPVESVFPKGSAVSVSNQVHYYVGRDAAGRSRVMRDVDGGAGTLISGIDVFRLDYFTKAGLPTSDPALVARVRVTTRLRASGGAVVQEVGIRS